jgi:hypothetical protein
MNLCLGTDILENAADETRRWGGPSADLRGPFWAKLNISCLFSELLYADIVGVDVLGKNKKYDFAVYRRRTIQVREITVTVDVSTQHERSLGCLETLGAYFRIEIYKDVGRAWLQCVDSVRIIVLTT